MISTAFHNAIYEPLYNALVFLLSIIPAADVGIAVILLTIIVKIILFPLAKRAIRTQAVLKKISPQISELKKTHKNDQQEQVKQTLALYRAHDIHPLSGIATLFIQLPIIIGLYLVFWRGGLPVINMDDLYSFITAPASVDMQFLGLIPMDGRSIALAALAGVTQFIHARISIPATEKRGNSFADDVTHSLNIQMRYVLPVVVAVIGYTISAAVALYWTTSNVFTIIQELIVRRELVRREEVSPNSTTS